MAQAPGPRRNLLTDVGGLRVGHAQDAVLRSGATAILFDPPATASALVLGGAPGTRETDLLEPSRTVQAVDAIVLSGGSAFGLDAAAGVQSFLRAAGKGFAVAGFRVPIVPAAVIFDLANGGRKDWGIHPPYRELGWDAAADAVDAFALGAVGAGTGATTATAPGGVGSASTRLPSGVTVAALAVVNAVGSALVGDTDRFWAAPFEEDAEFGGLGLPHPWPADASQPRLKGGARLGANTTIAVIATDAVLSKTEAHRLAVAAHDGFARALVPAHTDLDGDIVFAAATGASGIAPSLPERIALAAAASSTMARAIARGVFEARSSSGKAPDGGTGDPHRD